MSFKNVKSAAEGTVLSCCISVKKGTRKKPVESIEVCVGEGIKGDAHAGNWHRQVSLLGLGEIDDFRARGADVDFGAFGENVVAEGFRFKELPIGTRLRVGDVFLEITQIGKECHSHCQIYHQVGDCIMPREGVFARVLHGGWVTVGDKMEITTEKIPLDAAVITASDKGARGEREDKSGAAIRELLTEAGYHVAGFNIVPDEKEQLVREMTLWAQRGVGLILTTGGTGFSVRDVTPEATREVIERETPGIPEAMRALSMQVTPRAMLTRAAAGIRKRSLIVNLPGSEKAVRECLSFILPQLQHGIEILRGDTGECAR